MHLDEALDRDPGGMVVWGIWMMSLPPEGLPPSGCVARGYYISLRRETIAWDLGHSRHWGGVLPSLEKGMVSEVVK